MKKAVLLLLVGFFVSCGTTFDPIVYQKTLDAKEKTINLMERSVVDNYDTHEQSIDSLKVEIDSIYNYEKSRPKNDITIKMWDVVKKKDGVVFWYFDYWKKKKKIKESYFKEYKMQVRKAFDDILEQEQGKK